MKQQAETLSQIARIAVATIREKNLINLRRNGVAVLVLLLVPRAELVALVKVRVDLRDVITHNKVIAQEVDRVEVIRNFCHNIENLSN